MDRIQSLSTQPTSLQQQWRTRLNDQAASGQSVSAWCRAHGYSRQQFYYWRKKLGSHSLIQIQDVSPGNPSSVQFVKVIVGGHESC